MKCDDAWIHGCLNSISHLFVQLHEEHDIVKIFKDSLVLWQDDDSWALNSRLCTVAGTWYHH